MKYFLFFLFLFYFIFLSVKSVFLNKIDFDLKNKVNIIYKNV